MTRSFEITIKGCDYIVDVVESGIDTDVYIERVQDDDSDIPEKELLGVIKYLVKEGFIREP